MRPLSESDKLLLSHMVDRASVRAILVALADICTDHARMSETARSWRQAANSLARHALQKAYGRR